MKKTVSLILSIAMVLSVTVFVATPVSAGVVDTVEYNSRTNYPAQNMDAATYTCNWDDQWSAQVYDPALNDGAGGFEQMVLNTLSPKRFTAKSALGSNAMNTSSGAMVYEIGMWPTRYTPPNADELAKAQRIYAAQVFTAPTDGYYLIKGATVNNTMTAPINVRIRKNGQAIEGALDEVYSTTFTYNAMGVELKAGDMLSFETGYKAVEGVVTLSSGGVVDWTPVVAYCGKNTYKSTDKYPTAVTADGTWESGIWSAKLYDPVDSKFYPMTAKGTGNNRFTVSNNFTETGTSSTAYNSSHIAMVISGTQMWPTRHTDGITGTSAEVANRGYVAIVFTAPKSGLVKISGGSISNGIADNGVVARIRRNTESEALVSKNLAAASGSATYDDIFIEVNTGDMISFEAGIDGSLVNCTSGFVTWSTPEITYVDMRSTFRANEAFSTETGNSNWDNVWSAKVYNPAFTDYTDGFIDLTAITNEGARYALPMNTPAGNVYNHAYGAAPTVGTGNGGNLMIPSRLTTSSSTTEEVKEAYVAQVFTAPRTGWVTISGTENNKLSFTASQDETVKMNTRIRLIGKTDEVVLKDALLNAGDTYFHDIYGIYLNAGDRISFEAKYDKIPGIEGSVSGGTLVWGPIVTYIDEPAVRIEEITFTKDEEEVTEFADIASGTVDVSADIYAKDGFSGKVYIAIYNEDNAIVSCEISENKAFAAGETTTATIQLTTDTAVEKGSIRIYIFEDNLIPALQAEQTYLY